MHRWTKTRLSPKITEAYKTPKIATPTFGKRKRQTDAEHAERAAEAKAFREARRQTKESISEDDAWAAVSSKYEFMLKPAYHSWTSFHDELQRYELQWKLLSAYDPHYEFKLTDRWPDVPPANGDAFATIFTLLSHGDSDGALLHAVSRMYTTNEPTQLVKFEFRDRVDLLELETYVHRDCPVEPPIEETYLWTKAAARKHLISAENNTALPPTPEETSVAMTQTPSATTTALGAPLDQLPWLCVRGRLTDELDNVTPTLFDVSLQCFTSIVLRGLVTFLNSRVDGTMTYELVPRLHMTRDIVPFWRSLRAAAKMHPAPWPVDPMLLPDMMPPGGFHGTPR